MTRPAFSFIQIGAITAAHGIRGQVKIRALSPAFEDIAAKGPLSDAEGKRLFSIKIQSGNERGFIASIKGIDDRNAAELLRGIGLYAAADKVPVSMEDKLAGLQVKLSDGTMYGEVLGVYNFGAGDIVEIRKTDGKAEMLPLNEHFVTEIAADKGYIVINPPEYLEAQEP